MTVLQSWAKWGRAIMLGGLGLLAGCGGGGGSTAADFAIRVTVSGLTGAGLVLQNQSRDNLSITTNGVATFTTRMRSGAVYAVRVANQPSSPAQGCVVANANGTVVAADIIDIAVVCRNAARFAYVANADGNNITQFTVGVDGRLTRMGGFVTAGLKPNSVAIDPQGRYLYATNEVGKNVSQYTIGNDGQLNRMVKEFEPIGDRPTSIAIDPSGRFVYVSTDAGTVSQYLIGAGGMLVPMASPPVAGGVHPVGIAVDPSGRFAYLANDGGTVSQYAIAGDGSLIVLAADVTVSANPTGVTIDPLGRVAYVTHRVSNRVEQFPLAANGSLIAGALPYMPVASWPVALATDPDGRFAWTANLGSNNIHQFRILANGSLDLLATAPVAAGINPNSLAVDPTGRFLYATSGINTVLHFDINTDGSLTARSSVVGQGNTPVSIAIR